jgi:inositol-phosphate phosphatase / L-galactose 1-phosphate phosphatase / histidinol-phosphatase
MNTTNQASNKNLDLMLTFINHLADLAASVSLRYFRSGFHIDVKDGLVSNMATIADREAEEIMVNEILRQYPEYGIIREEGESVQSRNGYNFVLDPIDGTSSFVAGRPIWGTLIALVDPNEEFLVGLIDQPFLKERIVGAKDRAPLLNGVVVKSNQNSDLSQAISLKSTPATFKTEAQKTALAKIEKLCGSKSVWGGDCYSYLCMAAGYSPPSVIIECEMQYFDFAALVPIVEGAGGAITNWRGQKLTSQDSEVVASSNAKLHEIVLNQINCS